MYESHIGKRLYTSCICGLIKWRIRSLYQS